MTHEEKLKKLDNDIFQLRKELSQISQEKEFSRWCNKLEEIQNAQFEWTKTVIEQKGSHIDKISEYIENDINKIKKLLDDLKK